MVGADLAFDLGSGAGGGSDAHVAEHDMVRLSARIELDDGRSLPSGTRGAVVFVHGGGAAYEVEFIVPFHAVATVSHTDLSHCDGA